jgi:hypothetical protein
MEECALQTYFTAKGRIDYFVVVDEETGRDLGRAGGSVPLTQPEKELFAQLEQDYEAVKGDIGEQASNVHDFGDSRSERVPWLETTGYPHHLATLRDEEIWSSYKLPPKRELDADTQDAKTTDLRPDYRCGRGGLAGRVPTLQRHLARPKDDPAAGQHPE